MRVRHRGQHVEEQPHARRDVERRVVAVAVDALAVDVLEDQVRLARAGHAGVDQARDVRVGSRARMLPSRLKRSSPARPISAR